MTTLLVLPRAFHGTEPFELSGQLVASVSERPGRQRYVFLEPGHGTEFVVQCDGPDELCPPLQLGETATVQVESFSPDVVPSPEWRHIRIRDAVGRLRWAGQLTRGLEERVLEPELTTLAEVPACAYADELMGIGLDVSLLDGPPVRAQLGEPRDVTGGGATGWLHLSAVSRGSRPEGAPTGQTIASLTIEEWTSEPGTCRGAADCRDDEYCEVGVGGCDATGRCLARPRACRNYPTNQMRQRACACDGRVFDNACLAHLAGVDFSLADGSECAGVFRCGWFSCLVGREACLKSATVSGPAWPSRCHTPWEGGQPVSIPANPECDPASVGCACYVLDGLPCTCEETRPGEPRITCTDST